VWIWVWVGAALLWFVGTSAAVLAELDSLADIVGLLPVGATIGVSVTSAVGLLTGFRRMTP
jgi:hypothetical protein